MGQRCFIIGRERGRSFAPHALDEGAIPIAVLRQHGAGSVRRTQDIETLPNRLLAATQGVQCAMPSELSSAAHGEGQALAVTVEPQTVAQQHRANEPQHEAQEDD